MGAIKKTLFLLALSALSLWAIFYSYNRLTDGFSVRQISSPLVENQNSTLPDLMFDQPFFYKGKGCQFYVLEGERGDYVLKFFKQKHLRDHAWISRSHALKRRQKHEALMRSCQLAYEVIPKETGVLYTHFWKEPGIELPVKIIDKLGRAYFLNINEYEFIIQKKCTDAREVLSQVGDKEKYLQALEELVSSRCMQGIGDRDKAFLQNVGFTSEGQALMMDVGQLYEEPLLRQEEEREKEMHKRLHTISS